MSDQSFTVPSGAFTLTMKSKALGSDRYEAMEAMRGERERWEGNSRLAYAIYCRHLAASLITNWDRTRPVETDKGMQIVPLPITAANLQTIEDERDYEFVVTLAIERVTLRPEEQEGPFAMPSTPLSKASRSSRRRSRAS